MRIKLVHTHTVLSKSPASFSTETYVSNIAFYATHFIFGLFVSTRFD